MARRDTVAGCCRTVVTIEEDRRTDRMLLLSGRDRSGRCCRCWEGVANPRVAGIAHTSRMKVKVITIMVMVFKRFE